MIDWLVGYALRKHLVVAMICVFVSVFGYYSWTQLAIDAYPDVADTSTQVITQPPGLAAEEVEQQITIPLERELNGTPGLLLMRSKALSDCRSSQSCFVTASRIIGRDSASASASRMSLCLTISRRVLVR